MVTLGRRSVVRVGSKGNQKATASWSSGAGRGGKVRGSIFGRVMWVNRATPVGAAAAFAVLLSVAVALLVLGGPSAPEASAAGKKPDLVVSQLSSPPGPLEPGQKFRATSTTKNAGQARAAASTTRFYLSGDRLKGTGDVRFAAGQSVGTLGVGNSARATTTLAVPAATKPERSYYLIACADDPKKVGESRETNNCRASAERALVTENPFKTAPEFGFTPNPLTVTPTLEKSRAVTQKVSTWVGGTLTTTASDGTEYTLTLPKGALLSDEEITLTPVSGVGNLPMSGGLAAGVDIKPDGLQLHEPARLTITPPAGAEVPLSRQTGLSWHGGGQEFHLYALEGTEQLSFELSHFSAYGVGSATDSERAAAMKRMPTRTADQYRQANSELLRQEREAQLNGEPGDPRLKEKLADSLAGYYRDVVRPKMLAAETNDSLAGSAIQEGIGWSRQVELLGLSEDPFFAQKEAEVMDSVIKILQNAFDKAFARCVNQNDPSQAVRLLALERHAQLMGVSLGDVFDKLDRCVRFELDFRTALTEDRVDSTEHSGYHATVGARVQGLELPWSTRTNLGLRGEKAFEYTSWNIDGTGECYDYSPLHTDPLNPFQVNALEIRYNAREEMGPDGQTVRTTYPPEIAMYVSGGTGDEYSTETSGLCDGGTPTPRQRPHAVYQTALSWLQPTVSTTPILDWNFQGGSTWATKSFSRSVQPDWSGASTFHGGQSTLTLRHVPQP